MLKKIEHGLEVIVFNSRWLLAPFFLGLIVSIILLFVKFSQELFHLSAHVVATAESEVIIGILTLVDITLVGSLLMMIIFSGYEIFVSKIGAADHPDRPDWMGKVDFSGLKLKVIGAIVAISAIELLKTFVEIPHEPGDGEVRMLTWKVVIHMAFVLSGVFFALTDRIASGTPKH